MPTAEEARQLAREIRALLQEDALASNPLFVRMPYGILERLGRFFSDFPDSGLLRLMGAVLWVRPIAHHLVNFAERLERFALVAGPSGGYPAEENTKARGKWQQIAGVLNDATGPMKGPPAGSIVDNLKRYFAIANVAGQALGIPEFNDTPGSTETLEFLGIPGPGAPRESIDPQSSTANTEQPTWTLGSTEGRDPDDLEDVKAVTRRARTVAKQLMKACPRPRSWPAYQSLLDTKRLLWEATQQQIRKRKPRMVGADKAKKNRPRKSSETP